MTEESLYLMATSLKMDILLKNPVHLTPPINNLQAVQNMLLVPKLPRFLKVFTLEVERANLLLNKSSKNSTKEDQSQLKLITVRIIALFKEEVNTIFKIINFRSTEKVL